MAVDRKLLDDNQWTVAKMMVNHIVIAHKVVVTFIVAAVVGAVLSHLDA